MFSTKELIKYLKRNADSECTLTDAQFEELAEELYEVGYEEEMMSGEDYESIEEFDIGEVIDSSDGGSIIRVYGYNWLGLDDDDKLDDDMDIDDI